ncbi:MAG: Oar protein, partial [Rhodanobacter sp.]
TVITSQQLAKLPLLRNAEAIAQLAPGVNAGTSAFAALTGPEGQTLNTFGGSTIAENAYYINGFNTTDPLHNFGGLTLPYGAIDQEQVLTGGYSARFGRSDGGVINMVGKRGTNEWHFGFAELWQPDFAMASPHNQSYPVGPEYKSNADGGAQGQPYRFRNDNKAWQHTEDFYVGGPLIQDKLFFFGAYEANREVSGQNVGSVETKQATTFSRDNPKWYGKLDWNINDNNILELTGASNKSSYTGNIYAYNYATDGSNRGTYGAFKGPDTHTKNGADMYSLRYTGYLTDSLTVDALYGKMKQTNYSQASGSQDPFIARAQFQNPALNGGVPIVGPQTIATVDNPGAEDKTRNLRLDINYKIGDHSITAGIDNLDTQALNIGRTRSGPGFVWFYGKGDPNLPISSLTGQEVGAPGGQGYYAFKDVFTTGAASVRVKQRAQFIEDNWQVTDNVLVTIGVRNDQFTNYNPDAQAYLRLTKPNWSPRLGATWDVYGDSSLKVYANAGRYYLDEPANVAIRGASGSTFTDQYFTYTGIDPATGQPTGLTQIPQGHYPGVSANNEFGVPPDPRQVTSKNAKAEYQDEYIAGLDKAFDLFNMHWTAGAKGTYRHLRTMLDDVCATDVFANTGAAQGFDPVAAEGQGCYIMNPGRNSTFNVPLVAGSTTSGYGTMTVPWSAFGMPNMLRKYLGLNMYLEHPFDGKWYGRLDYTISHSFGNTEGSVRSDIGQADVAQTEDWDNSGVMTYSGGDQSNDRRHEIKFRGYYQITPEWLVGGTALILSGTPRSCLGYFGPQQTDPFGYRAAYHFCGAQGTPAPRGSTGRTPWQEIVGLNVEYRPAFADHKLAFSALVYNLFNQQRVTQYFATSESGPGTLSKDFWVPISQQQPRYIQFGVTYDF